MRARHKIREQLYRTGETMIDDELRELQLEVLLDIRDVLVRMYNESDDYGLATIEYDE